MSGGEDSRRKAHDMKKPATAAKKKVESVEALKVDTWQVLRVHMFQDGSVTFDLVLNGINIYGCKVVEGKDGDFISFPSRQGKDKKYYSIVWAKLSAEDTADILAEVENQLNAE